MSLTVVGGIYLERVIFPPDEVIYGSGGRAAAALKSLDPNVVLHSFIGETDSAAIKYHAEKIWRVPLIGTPVAEMISFSYYHGMSRPIIRPTRLPLKRTSHFEVIGEAIVQFGMLDGRADVKGDRVVFDPQNPESPQKFGINGSEANELAYVLNRGEARHLTGEAEIDAAAAVLLKEGNVRVVVIKNGAEGARVFSAGTSTTVHAYKTKRVWPIGSGDIFAAVFAHYWATERMQPQDAALLASRGTALYCERRELPLSRDRLEAETFEFRRLIPKRRPSNSRIYLAGPFFTMGQLWLVEEARNAMVAAGFDVFSPYHDVGVGKAEDVVPSDIEGIRNANAMFALCDGLDAGTLFEIGYAVRHGVPVVAFAEQITDEAMKMLYGTGCTVLKDFTSAVYQAEWSALQ